MGVGRWGGGVRNRCRDAELTEGQSSEEVQASCGWRDGGRCPHEPRTQLYNFPVGLAATSSKLLRSEVAYGPLTEQLLGKKLPKGSLEG